MLNIRWYKVITYGKKTREYKLYRDILTRANYPEFHKVKPSYMGTKVCDSWLYFQNFASDINSMIGFNDVDENGRAFSLDKDLSGKGGRL